MQNHLHDDYTDNPTKNYKKQNAKYTNTYKLDIFAPQLAYSAPPYSL